MIDWSFFIVALLGPWLAGTALVGLSSKDRISARALAEAVPFGFFLGAVVAGTATYLGLLTGDRYPAHLVTWGILLGGVGLWILWFTRSARFVGLLPVQLGRPPAIFILLIAIVGGEFGLICAEAWLGPALGWDTWQSWLPQALIYEYYGDPVAFIETKSWLEANNASDFRLRDASDPPLIPLLMLWTGAAGPTFAENAYLMLWPFVWLNIVALIVVGGMRFGLTPNQSGAAGLIFATLPYPMIQAMIPGYSDIWVSGFFLALVIWFSGQNDLDQRGWRWYLVGLTLLLGLMSAKSWGILWAILAAGCYVSVLVLGRVRFIAIAGMIGALTFGLILSVLTFSVSIGPISLMEYQSSFGEVARFLFLSGDWHFLFWAALPLLSVIFRYPITDRQSQTIWLVSVASLTVILWGFCFTDKAYGVLSGTTFNRAVLHIIPIVLLTVAVIAVRLGNIFVSTPLRRVQSTRNVVDGWPANEHGQLTEKMTGTPPAGSE